VDIIPPEALLSDYPPPIAAVGEELRAVVLAACPDAIERVRTGWRLIGYDLPAGRRTRFFAFVWPEPEHMHLGFEYGIWMADPDRRLRGAHLRLKKVRFLTFEPGTPVDPADLVPIVQEAARVARLTRAERLALALEEVTPAR
jgi:hypothetical protein